jgi:hypothetical protein
MKNEPTAEFPMKVFTGKINPVSADTVGGVKGDRDLRLKIIEESIN